jgi:hypothetical protein
LFAASQVIALPALTPLESQLLLLRRFQVQDEDESLLAQLQAAIAGHHPVEQLQQRGDVRFVLGEQVRLVFTTSLRDCAKVWPMRRPTAGNSCRQWLCDAVYGGLGH